MTYRANIYEELTEGFDDLKEKREWIWDVFQFREKTGMDPEIAHEIRLYNEAFIIHMGHGRALIALREDPAAIQSAMTAASGALVTIFEHVNASIA